MCLCDFSDERYWEVILIQHMTHSGPIMLLSENTCVDERDSDHIILRNIRNDHMLEVAREIDDEVMQQDGDEGDTYLRVLPVIEYLLDNPSEVALIKCDPGEREAYFIGFPKETLHIL